MKAFKEINRHPTRSTLLQLSGVLVLGFGLIGALQHFGWGLPEVALRTWAIGGALAVAAQLPALGRFVYIGWMGLGVALGLVVQPVVMLALYLVFFVPVGLLFRLLGRDLMRRRLSDGAGTYWESYPQQHDLKSYFRQG